LALLADISLVYYVRLETGRVRRPSESVIESLARALQLDVHGQRYLRKLASAEPSFRTELPPEELAPEIAELVNSWKDRPAYVLGRKRDVLAANRVSLELQPFLSPGTNQVVALFCDPMARAIYTDWEAVLSTAVAGLRAMSATDLEAPEFKDLIAELSKKSERFERLWQRQEVTTRHSAMARFNYGELGVVKLPFIKLGVMGSDRQVLVVHYAAPTAESAAALTYIAAQAYGTQSADPSNTKLVATPVVKH
jgi:hypothetical protein